MTTAGIPIEWVPNLSMATTLVTLLVSIAAIWRSNRKDAGKGIG